MNFFRGGLSRDLMKLIQSEMPDVTIADFQFLKLYGVEVKPLPTANAVDVAEVTEAEVQRERASLRLFQLGLEKEQASWDQYSASAKEFDNRQKVSLRTRISKLNEEIADKASEMLDLEYPVIALTKPEESISVKVASLGRTWLSAKMLSPDNSYMVYWADLTKLGSKALDSARIIARLIAEGVTQKPERTIGIIVAPNCGHAHNKYDEYAMEEVIAKVEELFGPDQANNDGIQRRRISFCFQSKDGWHDTRPGVLPGWVVLSSQRSGEVMSDREIQWVSEFTKSGLWRVKAVRDIDRKDMTSYVAPYSRHLSKAQNMSQSARYLQVTSGHDVFDKVRDSIWIGTKATANDGAVIVDLCGYDDSLAHSCLLARCRGRSKQPQEMLITTIWAATDVDDFNPKRGVAWITSAVSRLAQDLCRDKVMILPGLDIDRALNLSSQCPTYDESNFTLCMPMSSGSLALRQSAIDEHEKQFVRLAEEFELSMRQHNATYNISGVPYKGEKKRTEPSTTDRGISNATDFRDADTVESLEKLKEAGEISTVSQQKDLYELIFSQKEELYLHALTDGIVDAHLPLANFFGVWSSGEDEINTAKKRKSFKFGMPVAVTTLDYEAYWHFPEDWDKMFENRPRSLQEFLDVILQEKNITMVEFQSHELKGDTIVNTEEMLWEPRRLPARMRATISNAASLIDVSKIKWNGDLTQDTQPGEASIEGI